MSGIPAPERQPGFHRVPSPPCDACKTTSGIVRVDVVVGTVRRTLCAACYSAPIGEGGK